MMIGFLRRKTKFNENNHLNKQIRSLL